MPFNRLSSFRASSTSKKSDSTSSTTGLSNEVIIPRPQRSTISANLSRKLYSILDYHDPWEDIPTTTLVPSQAQALTYLLSLPLSAPLLSTKIAWLRAPLSRHKDSLWPQDLCETHTWFEPRYLRELTQLIAKELWERSEGLYAFPWECMGKEVRSMLYDTLWHYRHEFALSKDANKSKGPDVIGSPYEAFAKPNFPMEQCMACRLSSLFQDEKAVKALTTLCKGRKRHKYTWPELLAFLEPVERRTDPDWRARWIKDGKDVRRERRRVRLWRKCGGTRDTAARLVGNPDAGEECPIVYTPTRKTNFEEEQQQPSLNIPERQTFGYSECVQEISDDLEDEYEGFKAGEDDHCETLLPAAEDAQRWTNGSKKAYQALHGLEVEPDTADIDEWLTMVEERLHVVVDH